MTGKDVAQAIRNFLIPRPNPRFFIRLVLVSAAAWAFFSHICIPAFVNGDSMLPTYRTGNLLFCWTPAYRNDAPKRGDVVMIAYPGKKVMLLKRVIATQGQTVAFRNGRLILDGKAADEPWAHAENCTWEAEEITVSEGRVYVIGDNRTMPMLQHPHGEVDLNDIVGRPIEVFNESSQQETP